MKRTYFLTDIIVFISIFLLGAGLNSYGQSIGRATFETIDRGLYSGYESNTGHHVIEIYRREDWSAIWRDHTSRITPVPPLLEIDFEDYFVIVAMDEERTGGGYSLEIKEVTV